MNRTTIEWVKNPDGTQGYTWNPITGCLGPNGNGKHCPYCYARKLANGRLKRRYSANRCTAATENMTFSEIRKTEQDPFYPRFWQERLGDIPRNWKTLAGWQKVKPRGIFVCDMGELFGDWVPREWQEGIFSVIKSCPQHRFYLLTKQDQNLSRFWSFPENCWVGVTATDNNSYRKAIYSLSHIKARVKYISFEPLLERIPISIFNSFIDWVIVGLQTPYSPKTAPKPEWIAEIIQAADKAGVSVFLKNNLEPLLGNLNLQENSLFFRADGNLRQEFPK